MTEGPRLYILMRGDMESMNSGKGMAQAAHAANQFIYENEGHEDVERWQQQTSQGFGTTITLIVTGEQLDDYVNKAYRESVIAGITHDPSYPIQDGAVTHLIPINTCGYIFSSEGPLEMLDDLQLHP